MVAGPLSCAASVPWPHETAHCSLSTACTFTPLRSLVSVGKVGRGLAGECGLGGWWNLLLRRGVLPLLPSCDHRVVAVTSSAWIWVLRAWFHPQCISAPTEGFRLSVWTWILYSLSISACLWSKAPLGGLCSHPHSQRVFVSQSWLISLSDSSELKELSKQET